ncbi:hypothetical protein HZS_7234, partial [Henneguya salminicola]
MLHILSTKSVVVDFEMGLINASYNLGIDLDVYGCVFHYVQSLWRKLERLNMAFQFLIDQIKFYNLMGQMEEFIRCFERTYFGSETIVPLYSRNIWNHFRTKTEKIRTKVSRYRNETFDSSRTDFKKEERLLFIVQKQELLSFDVLFNCLSE